MRPAPDARGVELPAAAATALRAGRKVDAVKLVREATGLGLREAKALVERYAADPAAVSPAGGGPGDDASARLSAAAVSALHGGRMIDAVRIVRSENAIGLKDAKDAVDRYLAEHPAARARIDDARAQSWRGWVLWLAVLGLAALGIYQVFGQ